MSKQRNDNIGHMVCPMQGCTTQAAVRRNVGSKLYCDCPDHGRITPNLPEGQEMMMENAHIWGAGGPPGDCARWIAEQWSWGRVMRDPEARKPVNGDDPVNGPAPVPEAPPVESASGNGPPPPPEPPAEPAPEPEAEDEEETDNEAEFS